METSQENTKKHIFTFWEPKDKVPGYISLCMKTWEKYLTDYQVTVMDYEQLAQYFTQEELDETECRDFTLAMQADVFRCALLRKYGGIWFDTDTIITPAFDTDYFCKGDFCTVGSKKAGFINGAYIYNAGPCIAFTQKWYDTLKIKLVEGRKFRRSALLRVFKRKRWRIVRRWDFCMNSIIQPMANVSKEPDFVYLERSDIRCFPEAIYSENPEVDNRDDYRRFWFTEGETEEKWQELARNKGIIMLHNSWTPKEFRSMSEEEFLNSGCFLAIYLKKILGY